MKKMMMIAAMMIAAVTVKAQQAGETFLKPMVGATLATVTNNGNDMKFGLVAGAELGHMISDQFGLSVGALYTQQGGKNSGVKSTLEYINVPVLANLYVAQGFALKAGVQLGILLKAKTEDVDVKDICKSTAFAIPVGISYEFSNVVLDFRYNIGATKVNKEGDAQRGDLLQLTVGYKFEL
jgi:hypothetical protein